MASGIRLSISQRCKKSCALANIGNAVNADSATAAKGTRVSSVVKVRLLAVSARLALRKRSAIKRSGCSHADRRAKTEEGRDIGHDDPRFPWAPAPGAGKSGMIATP